jgi:Pyridine nucleotide-disulphide oxidoreductase, dimerisation domain
LEQVTSRDSADSPTSPTTTVRWSRGDCGAWTRGPTTQRSRALHSPIRKSLRSGCRKLPRARGIDVVVASADPAETARGYIHDFHRGALKLVGDRKRGVLIGATLVTPRAGEIVGELVLAIKLGTPLHALADVIHPFPAFNRMLGASLEELAAKVA